MKKDFVKLLCNFGKQCDDLDQKRLQAAEFPCLKHDLAVYTANSEVELLLHMIFEHLDTNEDLVNDLVFLKKALRVIIDEDKDDSSI